jgi:homoserine kinase
MRLQGRIPLISFLFTNKSQFIEGDEQFRKTIIIMWEQVQETVGYINKIKILILNGVILGSGLGSFTRIST